MFLNIYSFTHRLPSDYLKSKKNIFPLSLSLLSNSNKRLVVRRPPSGRPLAASRAHAYIFYYPDFIQTKILSENQFIFKNQFIIENLGALHRHVMLYKTCRSSLHHEKFKKLPDTFLRFDDLVLSKKSKDYMKITKTCSLKYK